MSIIMEKKFIFSKNGLMYFLLMWIISIGNVTCQQAFPMYINNGYIESWCSRKYNDTCSMYQCDSGYVKSPNIWILTCKEPGKWVGFQGQTSLCLKEEQICPERFKGGYIDSYCNRIPGDVCTYQCNPGFIMNGGWLRRLTCGENGKWSQDANSICIESEEYCPMYINNGYIGSLCSRKYNDTCSTYQCDSGYVKSPNNWILTCKEPGKWVGFQGQTSLCLKKDQICPEKFKGGYIDSYCNRNPGDVCTYQCNPGFIMNGGWLPLLTCRENGKWSQDTNSICIKTEQACPMYINNGYIGSWCSRKYNDMCSEYQCDSGYVKSPNNWILTCKEPGKWVGFRGETNLCLKIYTTSPSVTFLTTSAAFSTIEGNVGAIVGIIIGTLIGMILIVATVVWIARRSSVHKSQRRVPGHAGSLCLSPRENPEQHVSSIQQRPNTNGISSVSSFEPPSYNGPYVHSFGQQIPTISRSCKYPGPPPSYSEIQITPNEFPPTYKEVVTDPSRFNVYI